MKIAKDNIILIAIGLLIVLSVFKKQTVTIEGYTSKDVEYLLKIKDLENDKKHLKYEIEIFKEELIKIVFLFLMLHQSKLIAYSQNTSTDSLKCFTYTQARKILTDLRQLPIKDSIIDRLDSINYVDSVVIELQAKKVEEQQLEINEKSLQLVKVKKRSKIFLIFGGLLGLATQLIF